MENDSQVRPSKIVVITSLKLSEIILDKGQTSLGSTFETLLFLSLYVLTKFKAQRPILYPEFEEDLIEDIKDFCVEGKIANQLPCEFTEFVNNRFQLYGEQLSSMVKSPTFIPTKIIYNFYEKPLTIKSGDSWDLQQLLVLMMKLKRVFEVIDKSVDMLIEIYYSFNPINTKNPEKRNENQQMDPKYCFVLAYRFYEDNKLEQAMLALTILLNMEPTNTNAILLFIEIALKDNSWPDAAEKVNSIEMLLRTHRIELDDKQKARFNDLSNKSILASKKGKEDLERYLALTRS